jgi:hypothetical protein
MPRPESAFQTLQKVNPQLAATVSELIQAAAVSSKVQPPESTAFRCPHCSFEIVLGVLAGNAPSRTARKPVRRPGRAARKKVAAKRPARTAPARTGPNVATLAVQLAKKRKTMTGRIYAELKKAMSDFRNLPKDELRPKKMQWLREQLKKG